jgi:selenide,water dikinase
MRVCLLGGGHVNCQLLKLLKMELPAETQLTLVNEAPASYYSGMLPGSVSNLYKPSDITVEMEPVCKFVGARFVEQRVKRINATENKLELENGDSVEYDILAVNVGSRTKGGYDIPGVYEHSLTTRPINDLLGKIERKEQELIEGKITPRVVVCGAGCAGVELAFGFKARWEKVFNLDHVDVSLITNHDKVLPHEKDAGRKEIERKLKEKNI